MGDLLEKVLKRFEQTIIITLMALLAMMVTLGTFSLIELMVSRLPHHMSQVTDVVTLQEVGPNVVATESGTIDLTGLTPLGSGLYRAEMVPSLAFTVTGPANFVMADAYFFPFSGPGGFWVPRGNFRQ